MATDFKKGGKVHYSPKFGEKENGIVKRVNEPMDIVFVVYKCNDNWDNFENYTAQATEAIDIKAGWIEK